MPIKFECAGKNDQATCTTSDYYLVEDHNDDGLNSKLSLSSFRLPLPSLSQHMILSFENFRTKMDLNANRSKEIVKEEDHDKDKSKETLEHEIKEEEDTENKTEANSVVPPNQNQNQVSSQSQIASSSSSNEKTDEKPSDILFNEKENKSEGKSDVASKTSTSGKDEPDENNNFEIISTRSSTTKTCKLTKVSNIDLKESSRTNVNTEKVTEIWLSPEKKSFPLVDDKLSSGSLSDELQECKSDQNTAGSKIPKSKSKDYNFASPLFAPFEPQQICNNIPSSQDEEPEISWDQNTVITPTPSGALLHPEEYFYCSSAENSDIELMIKIPKVAFAERVLEELSDACSNYTITGIGMHDLQNKKRQNQSTGDKVDPSEDQKDFETVSVSIKEVPKPYVNIFGNPDLKKVEKEDEVSQLFFNVKGKRDLDSTGLNSPIISSPPSQPFIIVGVQDESRMTSKFPNIHNKFKPTMNPPRRKKSAATLTDPIGPEFWRAFIETPSMSTDATQTRVQNYTKNFFGEDPDSAKPSDLELPEFELAHNSANVPSGSGGRQAVVQGLALGQDEDDIHSERTMSRVSSWRRFTLTSDYSEQKLNIGNVQVQLDEPSAAGQIFSGVKGEKLLNLNSKSEEYKAAGGGLKKADAVQCTSETSISSASEIHKSSSMQNSKHHGRRRSKNNRKNSSSKAKTNQTLTKPLTKTMAIEGEDPSAGYSHSSSSCFSLPDDEIEEGGAIGTSLVKEAVFPLIKPSHCEKVEKEGKDRRSSPLRGDFMGDSLEKCLDLDSFDETSDCEEKPKKNRRKKNLSDDQDDLDHDLENSQKDSLPFKNHSPTSIKSSQGSVYSVGASLPPIPSAIRSQRSLISHQGMSHSPRRSRGRLMAASANGSKRTLVTLNKVSSSTLSGKRSFSFDRGEKLATMRPNFDYSKIHECDSIHLLRLPQEKIICRKKGENQPTNNDVENNNTLDESTSHRTALIVKKGVKTEEQKQNQQQASAPHRKSVSCSAQPQISKPPPARRKKFHHKLFGIFKWCQVKDS